MDILYSKNVRSFTMLHTDFLDCEMLNSNEKILLAILMRYDSYGKNNPPTTFPSFAGLARKSGLAEKVVKITLKALEEKQLICKQARYRNGSRARAANFYMIQDNPLLWKSSKADSSNTSNIDTFGDTIQEAIELLHFAGYKVMKPVNKETSFSDVGASEKSEFVSANNVNFVVKKGVRPFTIIYNDFLDFEGLRSKEKLILILLMRYGAARKNGTAFPSIETLARKTGMSERSVQYTLKKLIEKKLLIKQARFSKGKGQISNTYIIYDSPDLWKAKDSKLLPETFSQSEVSAIAETIHSLGYTVEKQATRENILIKDLNKKKASFSDVGASEKDESLSVNNVNFVDVSSISDDTSSELKSQAQISKLSSNSNEKLERYSKDFLYRHFDFESVYIIASQQRIRSDAVDSIFAILYDLLNSHTTTIMIGKEQKSTDIVISKLLKLDSWDILYVIEKYNSQITEIYSPLSWIRTALYFAREENKLSIINQINYNMPKPYYEG